MTKIISSVVCPHCGANTTNHSVCEYCGSHIVTYNSGHDNDEEQDEDVYEEENDDDETEEKDDVIYAEDDDVDEIEVAERYNYIESNLNYIRRHAHLVMLSQDNGGYELMSAKQFHPSVGYSIVPDVAFRLYYHNNGTNEELKLYLDSERCDENTYLMLGLSFLSSKDRNLLLQFNHKDSRGLYASINVTYFMLIAYAWRMVYVTKGFDDSYNMSEFIVYCARFYNLAFNKKHNGYSLNKQLITD